MVLRSEVEEEAVSRSLDPCVDHEQIMCSLCQEIDDKTVYYQQVIAAAEEHIAKLRRDLDITTKALQKLHATVDYWATAGLIENYSEIANDLDTSLGDVMDEVEEALDKIRGLK